MAQRDSCASRPLVVDYSKNQIRSRVNFVALCRRLITRPGSLQVHRYAFEVARRKRAGRITCAHKANIIIDDLAMRLVSNPTQFDVIVLTNLQGDIISDLCAGFVGGLGFAWHGA